MNPITKIILIIAAAAILAVAGLIITLNFKLSAARVDNLELKAEIARKETQIAKADASIKEQNEATERIKLEAARTGENLKNEYDRLNKKYTFLKDKVGMVMKEVPNNCETQLKLIYEAQEAFLWTGNGSH